MSPNFIFIGHAYQPLCFLQPIVGKGRQQALLLFALWDADAARWVCALESSSFHIEDLLKYLNVCTTRGKSLLCVLYFQLRWQSRILIAKMST